ncbi:MAG: segregation/condensation protein A [Chitinispirillaceae bacterium]|nr:segregation/condensation protein A [Chitinispirillaceae bacterium]
MPLKRGEYEVKLELFEGPLDLLLYLVNKAEVNIIDIKVAEVTTQYLEYLDLMRDLNIDIASEYLHMAATLIRLKARELLPPQEGAERGEEEEGIYNRDQLIAHLLEYKKFKEAAHTLRSFEAEHFGAFPRGAADVVEPGTERREVDFGNVGIFDLLAAFKRILDRTETTGETPHVVEIDMVKIDECIERVLAILCDRGEVRFESLFTGDKRKIVAVVTFMAILELVKMQEISFRQEENFGPIFVMRRMPQTEAKEGKRASPEMSNVVSGKKQPKEDYNEHA